MEQHDSVRDVFYVTSAAMLVRADLLAALGGFDPATFPGAEDLNLCWRAQRHPGVGRARTASLAARRRRSGRAPTDPTTSPRRASRCACCWRRTHAARCCGSSRSGSWSRSSKRSVICSPGTTPRACRHHRVVQRRVPLPPPARLAQAARRRRGTASTTNLRELQVGTGTRAFSARGSTTTCTAMAVCARSAPRAGARSTACPTAFAPATIAFHGVRPRAVRSRGLIFGGRSRRSARSGSGPASATCSTRSDRRGGTPASARRRRATCLGTDGRPRDGALRPRSRSVARWWWCSRSHWAGAFGAYRLGNRIIGIHGPALAGPGSPTASTPRPEHDLGRPARPARAVRAVAVPARRHGASTRAARATPVSTTRTRHVGAGTPAAFGARRAPRRVVPGRAGAVRAGGVRTRARDPDRRWYQARVPRTGARDRQLLARHRAPVPVAPRVTHATTSIPRHSASRSARRTSASTTSCGFAPGRRVRAGRCRPAWLHGRGAVVHRNRPAPGMGHTWLDARAARLRAQWSPPASSPTCRVPGARSRPRRGRAGAHDALGIGVSVLVDGIRTFRFGWRQPAAILGGLTLPAARPRLHRGHLQRSVASAGEPFDAGRFTFTQSLATRGQFRMLWVGVREYAARSGGARRRHRLHAHRNGPGDVTEQWRTPALGRRSRRAGDQGQLSEAGLTNRLGRMLAPMGVRYVVLPSTQGTGGGAKAPPSHTLSTSLASQLDLARLRSEPGFVFYENLALDPTAATMPPSPAMCRSTRPTQPRRARRGGLTTQPVGTAPVAPGTVLWAEAFNSHWATRSRGADLRHVETFGWSNGYRVRETGTVRARVHGPVATLGVPRRRSRDLALGDLALAPHACASLAVAMPKPSDRRAGAGSRPDPLAEVLDGEDTFWWERV